MAQPGQEQKEGQQKERQQSTFGNDKPWKCSYCNFMIGLVSPKGEVLRIKYKDLYLSVQGGRVELLCRKCGRVNVLEYTEDASVQTARNLRFAVTHPETGQRRPRR